MKKHVTSIFYIGLTVSGINQASFANHAPLLQSVTQEAGQQQETPIILAAGIDTRVERRHDSVENTAGIVRVMEQIVVLTTDRTNAGIPSTGQRTESMTDRIDVN
jgi:hypothetical protein